MKKILITLSTAFLISSSCMSQSAQDLHQAYLDLSVFQDGLASSLRKGVNKKQIAQIQNKDIRVLAENLLAGKKVDHYKLASYSALLSPKTLGRALSIGDGYSKYENVTGIYLPVGKHILIADGIKEDKDIKLVIPNWMRKAPNPDDPTKDPKGWGIEKKEFKLRNGVNIIELEDFGSLAYVSYFSDNPQEERPIQIHFLSGQVNGYFDNQKHTDEDWNSFLDHAVYPIMDAKGKHIQTAYPVEELKKYAYGRGKELISNYDSLVYRQHRLMGLIKYDKVPHNKILARVNYNYYMFRDGDGVAYMGDKQGYAMKMVLDPNSVIKGDPCWGFSHEVGHVHQTSPMLSWGGLGEVSNNIYSLYVMRSFGNQSRILTQDNFKKAKEAIIDKRISYLQDPDVFNRLVPFWQLQLYFEGEGKNPDFYPDLFETLRNQNTNNSPSRQKIREKWGREPMVVERNPAVHQLNFIKTACEVAKTDLTEFFDKYGFFYVGEMQYDDYGKYEYKMSQQMVDECKNAIKSMNLEKPKLDISTLTDKI
ncbi:M60 family metallopeptidase [Sphingobacterium suaedae]|uniref:M60 family metallopeptidase n=1 Tax=Sphingobacterium suaedae TaxID=1686402 RepID=A0ABW5KEA5_9SPHI